MNVFVCVDVLAYLHSPTEPLKRRRAREWVAHLWSDGRGRTSAVELAEYYAFLTEKRLVPLVPRRAWNDVSALLAWRPQPLDEALLTRAHEAGVAWRLTWRESLTVAAAQLQDCTVLLTEALRDGATYGTARVRHPFLHRIEQPRANYLLAA